MQRRNFIRLVGGGAVASSLATLTACSDAFPAEAVAAWQGPGNEPDVRRWALAYAILAPNSHNRQPWRVDLREPNAITLYVDRERMLPMTDPWFRQIVVSQGTFLESLVLALRERGLRPEVQLFPQGEFKPREVDDRTCRTGELGGRCSARCRACFTRPGIATDVGQRPVVRATAAAPHGQGRLRHHAHRGTRHTRCFAIGID